MSETYRQQSLGPPTFIDASASGSSSGRDAFNSILDTANLYHEQNYHPDRMALPLQIPGQDGFAPDHQFAYALHSNSSSHPGKHTPPLLDPLLIHNDGFNTRSSMLPLSLLLDSYRQISGFRMASS